jgi:hypothetical protein
MNYDRLIFDHVPKTAGSFVRRYLINSTACMGFQDDVENHYIPVHVDADGICDSRAVNETIQSYQGKPYGDIERPVLLSGHRIFNSNIFTPNPDDFYFTFIRNPIDVFYSDYYFVNRRYKDLPDVWPIDDILDEEYGINLNRRSPFKEYVDWFIDEYEDNTIFYEKTYNTYSTGKHRFIGIQEQMNTSMIRLCNWLDIEYDKEEVSVSVNGSDRPPEDYTYRRSEIGVVLSDLMDIYKTVLKVRGYDESNVR